MRRLIIHGDAGVRKEGIIDYDGGEKVLFQVTRNGDWHGPDEPQLWCIIGDAEEREDYEKRNFIPHFLEVESIDAEDLDVIKRAGDMAV
jgi:hypothetical protein